MVIYEYICMYLVVESHIVYIYIIYIYILYLLISSEISYIAWWNPVPPVPPGPCRLPALAGGIPSISRIDLDERENPICAMIFWWVYWCIMVVLIYNWLSIIDIGISIIYIQVSMYPNIHWILVYQLLMYIHVYWPSKSQWILDDLG